MTLKMKNRFACLMLFLMIFSIPLTHNYLEPTHEELKIRTPSLKPAGFWNNFTYIHVTNFNWTIANKTEWCSGSGTWGDPYLIENMIINASASPTGAGIFIENSTNVYFTIRNVTIFETTDGIKLENTNNGVLINNSLSDNLDSGISLVNSVNNTISRNRLVNNGIWGIYLFTNCVDNIIIGNTAINDGTNFQDTGIYLEDFCNDNEILENDVWDNDINGIYLQFSHNNTIAGNIVNCNNISGITLLESDNNTLSANVANGNNFYGFYLYNSNKTYIFGNKLNNNGNSSYYEDNCEDNEFFWNSYNRITPSFIIDENGGGDFTWAEAARELAWVTGSGYFNDPYIIKEVVIDAKGSGSGMLIKNSEAFFIIENCITNNSGEYTPNAGIHLSYVDNSQLINNDCSSNFYGIRLYYSNNINITGNTGHNNKYGIRLLYSNNNNLSGNLVNNNVYNGFFVSHSDNNNLLGNSVINHAGFGIYLFFSSYNIISGNILNNNSVCIKQGAGCSGNIFENNDCGQSQGIQGYNILFLLGILSIVVIILCKKLKKS